MADGDTSSTRIFLAHFRNIFHQWFWDKDDTEDMISTLSSEFDSALNTTNAQTVAVTVTYTDGTSETINLFKEIQ